jgi:cell wall-active antibiotic response 4TMS protein YvqF
VTRGWALFWGLVLVLFGGLALLFNTGLLQPEQLSRVLALWPLLLIIVGLQIVLARLLPRNAAAIAVSVIAFLLVASSVGYIVSAPAGHQAHSSFQATDSGSGAATLRIELGSSKIQVRGGSSTGAAIDYNTGFGAPPALSWDDHTRTFEISHSAGGLGLLSPASPDRLDITLDSSHPWSIEFDIGATTATLQLGDVQLQRLSVNGGADTLDLALGTPSGRVAVTISGGATKLAITKPAGVAMQVNSNGGANSLTVAGRNVGSGIGSDTWSTSNYPAADAFDVSISGGANRVTVDTST